jgi:hypothetical protein
MWEVESLAHEGVTNPYDLLPQLTTVLEHNYIDSLVLVVAISQVKLVILEEGESLASSSSEEKLL